MHELVTRIADNVGIGEATAEQAVRIILNFLDQDGPSDKVRELATDIGLSDWIAPRAGGGGLLAGLGNMMGGGAMAAFAELSSAGLDVTQVQGVTQEFVAYAREKAGPDIVDEIINSIPGLSQFI
ncbi:DUF2267 domain-containing protein [Methylobrevis albus]|uniref:DUF2267 domain-containing protein n=1 Tax=Methylobrevis albus TaxID=2793297 RepID=A0A931MXL8_9HYPH|nr:DUF2267 domain-containing protein [Methylobrevis albus]MBH0237085.1 DUF2267 domain-containing protein [Methylobrevis albus]